LEKILQFGVGRVWDFPEPFLDMFWISFKTVPTFFQNQQTILIFKKKLGRENCWSYLHASLAYLCVDSNFLSGLRSSPKHFDEFSDSDWAGFYYQLRFSQPHIYKESDSYLPLPETSE
jgi:hypothetical protein